jgi:glycosyltransferase involved in cell wall biosynthesis
VLVRYLVLNAYGGGAGTARTVLTMASALAAAGHEVHVVSVSRNGWRPAFPVHPRVRLVSLTDRRRYEPEPPRPLPPGSGLQASGRHRLLVARRGLKRALAATRQRVSADYRREHDLRFRPSTEFHPRDTGSRSMNALADERLIRYLRGLAGGVVMATRPGLTMAVARHAPPGVIRVGQEHVAHQSIHARLRDEMRRTYPALDALVTLTAADATAYRAALPGVRVVAIPNAVSGSSLRADVSHRRILAAGRLARGKAFWRLIDAFATLRADFPDWRVDIFGDGPERADLQRRIDEHGLRDQVRLRGHTRRLHREMARSSILALTSRSEGFAMVLLEAMSVGLPVISFACPNGPAEIVEDGVSGLLIPDGDIAAFTAGLRRLMSDEALRRSFVEPGLAVAARHAPDVIARQWTELFADLAATRP